MGSTSKKTKRSARAAIVLAAAAALGLPAVTVAEATSATTGATVTAEQNFNN